MGFRVFKSPDLHRVSIGNNTQIREGEYLVVGPVQGVPIPVR